MIHDLHGNWVRGYVSLFYLCYPTSLYLLGFVRVLVGHVSGCIIVVVSLTIYTAYVLLFILHIHMAYE